MKIPLNWISLYCDINQTIKEKGVKNLAHMYSIYTAEIDDIVPFGQMNGVVIGKVIEVESHPNSDHLNVVQVFLGEKLGKTQIVCGAENVKEALYIA
ncbi:MAG: phenylalanine--tRNA ligase subunit beta, partial [Candidatus Gracilibacteria bacterium]|nr:phenylalanine--tRNA ligase subunit beta [Candidatus Gracilibacteria bacterium]